jgi:ADP-ribose pyrophosphatase YjhB (NUDIX family)
MWRVSGGASNLLGESHKSFIVAPPLARNHWHCLSGRCPARRETMTSDQSTYLPAVSIAIFHEGAFLLVRRGREPSKGLYAFPGGRVDAGESDEEAVRRELAEETGLTVGALHPLVELKLPGADRHPAFRLLVFRGYGPAGMLAAGDDADAVGWFSLDEMRRLPVIPSVLETAQTIVADEPQGGGRAGA